MIKSVMVACRGVTACSTIQSLQRLGLHAVTVHSEADRGARHSLLADRAVCIGNTRAADCYSQAGAILDAARISGVDAIHPGNGELGSNRAFAEAVERMGIAFLGPSHATLRALLDATARKLLDPSGRSAMLLERSATGRNPNCQRLDIHFFGAGEGRII